MGVGNTRAAARRGTRCTGGYCQIMHAMSATEVFLLAILIIFTLPYAVWRLGRTDYWAPLVVVQIIGGILLGPGILGAIFPDYYAFVFAPATMGALSVSSVSLAGEPPAACGRGGYRNRARDRYDSGRYQQWSNP